MSVFTAASTFVACERSDLVSEIFDGSVHEEVSAAVLTNQNKFMDTVFKKADRDNTGSIDRYMEFVSTFNDGCCGGRGRGRGISDSAGQMLRNKFFSHAA